MKENLSETKKNFLVRFHDEPMMPFSMAPAFSILLLLLRDG
jgi:hypothetical protein